MGWGSAPRKRSSAILIDEHVTEMGMCYLPGKSSLRLGRALSSAALSDGWRETGGEGWWWEGGMGGRRGRGVRGGRGGGGGVRVYIRRGGSGKARVRRSASLYVAGETPRWTGHPKGRAGRRFGNRQRFSRAEICACPSVPSVPPPCPSFPSDRQRWAQRSLPAHPVSPAEATTHAPARSVSAQARYQPPFTAQFEIHYPARRVRACPFSAVDTLAVSERGMHWGAPTRAAGDTRSAPALADGMAMAGRSDARMPRAAMVVAGCMRAWPARTQRRRGQLRTSVVERRAIAGSPQNPR